MRVLSETSAWSFLVASHLISILSRLLITVIDPTSSQLERFPCSKLSCLSTCSQVEKSSDWYVLPLTNSAHLAQATTVFSEPPPWDSYLNQAACFFRGFLVTDFRYKNSKSRDLPLTNTHTQRRSPNFYMEEIKFPIQQKILRLSPKLLRQWRPASTGVTTKSLDHVKIEKRMDWLDQCKWTHFGLGFKSKWSVF